ncbi:hypothetical protein MAPG_11537 [Magnaporthiopsis poae ATCC 64411]|uniref:Phospholipase A2 n=1 Tax=Magnaporthiopsis poae (strain ATCC 64411 / 73-15) TaxID=644358 RepID=A0A0C4EFI7_MAGP6|nr:hypothetical protein MAPG_11537 [Magnaporthiopsis poae ATCC 64411]
MHLYFSFCLFSFFTYVSLTTALPVAESPPNSPRLNTRQTATVPPGVDVVAETDTWLFSTSMSSFLSALNAKNPPYLFWPSPSANACTGGPDHPWDFDFKRSCQRHDFGYKNYRDQKRFCEAGRKKIDDQFSRDLRSYCASRKWWKRPLCYTTTAAYVTAVRVNNPTYSRECYPDGRGGLGGSGRDASGKCLPGAKCT